MSYSYSKTSYTTSKSPKTSLLKDSSWIRRDDEEDEDVDRDPNFGKSVLNRYQTSDTTDSGSPTSYGTSSTSYRTSSTSLRSPTSSVSSVNESPMSRSSSTTTLTENGKTTTTTTTRSGTFTERVFSDGLKTSTKSSTYSPTSTKVTTRTSSSGVEDPFSDALSSDRKTVTVSYGTDGNSYSTTTQTRSSSSAEDKLYDTLIPSLKSEPSSVSTTVTRTSLVNVESPTTEVFPSSPTRRTYSTTEDKLYDTLLPRSMTDLSSSSSTTITRQEVPNVESSLSDNYRYKTYSSSSRPESQDVTMLETPSSDNYSYSRTYSSSSRPNSSSYEYSSITSPTVYTTSSTKYKDSSMEDYVDGDSTYSSKSSYKTVYSTPERTVLEKELCSYCHKPFNAEAKMMMDDMNIRCHASCFKCEVCKCTLGNLKAGDSLWIYQRTVHCDKCFDITRAKWRR